MNRLRVLVSILLLAASIGACRTTPPPREGGPSPSGEAPAEIPTTEPAGKNPLDFLGEVLIFLGADRPPVLALREIREVHDLKDWSHRFDVPNSAERCREAVHDLGESDYESWDDLATAVWVLSTMAVRDPSALVRDDAIGVLAGFRPWVHRDAVAMGRGPQVTEEDVSRALSSLKDLHAENRPHRTPAERMACMDGISVLGNYPWDRLKMDDPAAARAQLSPPRGVFRFLLAGSLEADRADPRIRDTLDRALVRLSDEVIFLTEVAGLADRAGHVRRTAAKALEAAGDPRAVGPLAFTLSREGEDAVTLGILSALGELGTAGDRTVALAAAAGRLDDPSPSVRRAAARAMAGITGENRPDDPAAWRRWWREQGGETSAR